MTDQQKAELACEYFGLWKREQACPGECRDQRFYGQYGDPDDMDHRPHDIPCPDVLHDKAAAMELLEALVGRVGWAVAARAIDTQIWECKTYDGLMPAIVRAAAAVAEASKA